jgi:hypothetical protein
MQVKPRLKKLRLYPLDTVDANADRNDQRKSPLILTDVELQASMVSLNPTIDEVQQLMHQLVNYILNTFHGVRKWGEIRDIDMSRIHDYPMHQFSELLSTNGNAENVLDTEEDSSRQMQQGRDGHRVSSRYLTCFLSPSQNLLHDDRH